MVLKYLMLASGFKIRSSIKSYVSLQERDLELEMGDDYVLDLQSK